jgi:hypothetical protein
MLRAWRSNQLGAPKGLIAVEDIPQAAVIRGLMW